MFLQPQTGSLWKALLKKEKMLVTSIFSFFPQCFLHSKRIEILPILDVLFAGACDVCETEIRSWGKKL